MMHEGVEATRPACTGTTVESRKSGLIDGSHVSMYPPKPLIRESQSSAPMSFKTQTQSAPKPVSRGVKPRPGAIGLPACKQQIPHHPNNPFAASCGSPVFSLGSGSPTGTQPRLHFGKTKSLSERRKHKLSGRSPVTKSPIQRSFSLNTPPS